PPPRQHGRLGRVGRPGEVLPRSAADRGRVGRRRAVVGFGAIPVPSPHAAAPLRRRPPDVRRPRGLVAAPLGAGGLRRGGRVLPPGPPRREQPAGADGAGARQRRGQQRLPPQGALPAHPRRALARPARRERGAQPGVRARRGRHAHRPPRPRLRRRVRPGRRLLHDHRGRPAAGRRDGVRPLRPRRRRPLRPGPRPRDVPPLHRTRRPRRRRRPRPPLPGLDPRPRPRGHDLPRGLRLPPPGGRRHRARGARPPRRGAVRAGGLAARARRGRLRAHRRALHPPRDRPPARRVRRPAARPLSLLLPMSLAAGVAVALVAVLHVAFLVLEMFLWTKPLGRRVFGLPAEVMAASAPLAANQGLYNGFLAAGLIWGLALGADGFGVRVFFLACVVVGGVRGFHGEAVGPAGAGVPGRGRPRARLAVAPVDSPAMLPDLRRLLAYHDWANGRFLDAAAALPETAWTRDLGSSFPSVQATMAHAIGAERVWLRRWQREAPTAPPAGAEAPPAALLRAVRTDIERE